MANKYRIGIAIAIFIMMAAFIMQSWATEVRYYPGWFWDTAEIRGGTPNSDYDVEIHFHTCSWHVEDSGTTDEDGDDDNRNVRWGPNDGIGPYDDDVRIHYTSGPSACKYVYATIKGRNDSGTRNSSVTGPIMILPPDGVLLENCMYTFFQNNDIEMEIWGEAGWILPGNFEMTLPPDFYFNSTPEVYSSNPEDLGLGAPYLSGNAQTVFVPIMLNNRLNPLESINIVADIVAPAGLPSGEYFYEFSGSFFVTSAYDPTVFLYSIDAVSYARGFVRPATDPCEGDFDGDGDVDGSDLAVFAADFGRTNCQTGPPCAGDFDKDDDVDGSDLAVFTADFGRTDCPSL